MVELLFAFLELVLEIFFEAAFEFAADFLGALILRGIAEIFNTSEFKNPLVACTGYVFLGGLAGGLSFRNGSRSFLLREVVWEALRPVLAATCPVRRLTST